MVGIGMRSRTSSAGVGAAATLLAGAIACGPSTWAASGLSSTQSEGVVGPATVRVSVNSHAQQGNRYSGLYGSVAVSANGRYVAFTSRASNLVPGDTNRAADVFVRDLNRGVTRRVSVSSRQRAGNRSSAASAISGNGRFVVFASRASNLVPEDTNHKRDVFVRDTLKGGDAAGVGQLERTSGKWAKPHAGAISADGRYVAFISEASNLVAGDTNGASDVFVRDCKSGVTRRVSMNSAGHQGKGKSTRPAISADGRYVAFTSSAANLVAGDTNDASDVFVRDRKTRVTRRVSVTSDGLQGNHLSRAPSLSAHGRYVAFASRASNLVQGDTNRTRDVFVHDRRTGATQAISVGPSGLPGNENNYPPAISADGRYVAFASEASNLVAGDTNGVGDVFVRDRTTGAIESVSVNSTGQLGTTTATPRQRRSLRTAGSWRSPRVRPTW